MIAGRKATITQIISTLSLTVRRHVVDRTGLAEQFNFDLDFAPPNYNGPTVGPSIFSALEDQLGLKLESTRGAVEVWIIDSAEKPSEN